MATKQNKKAWRVSQQANENVEDEEKQAKTWSMHVGQPFLERAGVTEHRQYTALHCICNATRVHG